MTELKVSETASDLLKENSEVKKKREYYINAMKYLKEADKNLNLDDEYISLFSLSGKFLIKFQLNFFILNLKSFLFQFLIIFNNFSG